jgi:hypothetical protein
LEFGAGWAWTRMLQRLREMGQADVFSCASPYEEVGAVIAEARAVAYGSSAWLGRATAPGGIRGPGRSRFRERPRLRFRRRKRCSCPRSDDAADRSTRVAPIRSLLCRPAKGLRELLS